MKKKKPLKVKDKLFTVILNASIAFHLKGVKVKRIVGLGIRCTVRTNVKLRAITNA